MRPGMSSDACPEVGYLWVAGLEELERGEASWDESCNRWIGRLRRLSPKRCSRDDADTLAISVSCPCE